MSSKDGKGNLNPHVVNNLTTLRKWVAHELGIAQEEAAKVVTSVIEGIRQGLLTSDRCQIAPLGVFKQLFKKERACRNPQTKEDMIVPACWTVRFKPSSSLIEDLKAKR